MNAKDKGRRYAEVDILENPGITRQDLTVKSLRYVGNLYINPKARQNFLAGWTEAVEAHFNAPAPLIYRIVDNYTGATEEESDDLVALKKELKVMQNESGLFIWHIEPDPTRDPANVAPIDIKPRQRQRDARASMADLIQRNPEILNTLASLPDPAKTAPDLYIASITVKCAICGDETIIDLSEKYDAAEVAEAMKTAIAGAVQGDQCLTCYADMQRAQALTETEGLEPLEDGE